MQVKIYSTPVCPYCNLLKDYLKSKNIVFEEIDVSQDQAAGKEMVAKSGQMGVPVSIITTGQDKEEVIIGFDKAKINEILNIKE